jgi:hypothetical protein
MFLEEHGLLQMLCAVDHATFKLLVSAAVSQRQGRRGPFNLGTIERNVLLWCAAYKRGTSISQVGWPL